MKFALKQLKNLSLNPSRPLIISDVDEVILHFSEILSEYLLTQGMYVNFTSYALEGNIKYAGTDKPVDSALFREIINDYFENYVEKQPLVKDVAKHLKNLSAVCDILILTNIPHNYANRRRRKLLDYGLNYPMISSSGPKGPVIKAIRKMTSGKLIFIDDISHHHKSVAKFVPDTLRIQYIANNHLNYIEKKSKYCHHRGRDWSHIEQIIRDHVKN
ncbi:MAG: hypothetical protein COB49_09375 [Alphaproteobacteria bacterium]|nr:MAG: hypothetical protein COB49_09375 [Alphaproteobacteria bacterium]